jgi:predicted membrane protein
MVLVKTDALDPYALAAYRFFMMIMGKIVGFAVWLFSLIAGLFIKGSKDLPEEMLERSMEQVQHSLLIEILFTLLYIALLATAAFLFIRLVISLIKLIPMRRKMEPTIIEDSDMVEIREHIDKTKSKKDEKLPKIRKRYKKTIEKAVKKGYALNRAHTVRERMHDLKEKRGEDISALSAEYEAVRYGQ